VSVPTHPVQLLAFEVCGRQLSLPVDSVETVLRAVAIAPLPHAPPFVEGIINLRGRVIPVVELRRRFGLPSVPLAPEHHFVVARTSRRLLALRVDQVHTVITVGGDALESAQRVVPGARHTAGIVRLSDGVIILQDLEALLSSEDEHRLDHALETAVSSAPVPRP
jgi:purine-binding chemotaxis protein CheW